VGQSTSVDEPLGVGTGVGFALAVGAGVGFALAVGAGVGPVYPGGSGEPANGVKEVANAIAVMPFEFAVLGLA
jgi:hypothetical protein